MKHLDYKKELYSKSDLYASIWLSKKEALSLAENLIRQANCDVSEIVMSMALKEIEEQDK